MESATTRSACCGVSFTLAVLFTRFESNSSEWLTDAVSVVGIEVTTVATIVNVCVEPLVTEPTFHTPVEFVYVPEPPEERNDRPLGKTSKSDTFVARFGPEFITVTV